MDGQLKIDAWGDMAGPTIFTTVVDLTAGDHTLRYEWYHGVGPATARLSWAEVSTSMLGPAEALHPGDWRPSADGHYALAYQGDNNLVVRRSTGEVAWESGTTGTGTPLAAAVCWDGDLRIWALDWQEVWSAGTAGHPGAWLQLANDELVLRDPEGVALWPVPLGAPLLTKQAPAHGATVTGGAVTLTWTAVAGENDLVCWDTTGNTTCEGTWTSAGTATTLAVTGLAPGTYYWQVKTAGGGVPADNGRWRSFTMSVAPPFAKQAPATGTTGLGSPVTLQWTAVSSEGYRVCWDTTNNSTCDTGWQENGGATTRALTALPVGAYYWQVKTTGSGVEADGGTWWSFTVTVPPVPADHWKAEYFGNRDLTGAAVATVDEGTGFVDHSWGTGGPAGLSDDFSARFTRTVTLAAGTYRFTVVTDDGSRLWVDGQPKIAAWWDQSATHTVDVDLSAGGHTLRYEYYEHTGGALARLTWELRTPVVLASGESLGENQTRVSLDGQYRLQYQGDGNLVVVRLADDSCAWSSQTNDTSVGAAVMQGDGNLVIYNGDWAGIWSTGTWGADGASLQIANDEMAIVAPGGTDVWAVSLLASAPGAAAEAWHAGLATGRGRFGGASPKRPGAVSAARSLMLALVALCGLVLWRLRDRRGRRLSARRPFDLLRVAPSTVEGRLAQGRPELGRGTATALFLTALLLMPATALAQTTTQVVEFYTTDAIGSVRSVTKQVNGEWTVVTRHDFMPFGEEVAPPPPPSDKRLFTGKERDSETGLDYFEAEIPAHVGGAVHDIDPAMTLKENLEDPQRWNRYTYVRNNPLRYVDPDGRMPVSAIVKALVRRRRNGLLYKQP